MTIDYNNEILQAIEYLIDAKEKAKEVKFDQTIVCEVIDNEKASEKIYWVKYNGNKMKVASLTDAKYKVGAKVYLLVPQGDFTQDKVIIGEYRTSEGSPKNYAIPSEQVIKITDNLFGQHPINNYDYGFGYEAKYLLFSATFTNNANSTNPYGVRLKAIFKDKNNNEVEYINEDWAILDSSNFYGNAQYADHSTQEILLTLPDNTILTQIDYLIYGDDAIIIENPQAYICYDKNDVPADTIAISAYTADRNQSYSYNSDDQENSLKSVDFYTKILYNQNIIEVDNNSDLLTDNDKVVWFKYELGYTSAKTGDKLTWETLAGTNWVFQTVADIDDGFTVSVDFNMATTQYKVMWISKDKIYDEEDNDTGELTSWLIRAQDSITFTNSARVVDELTAAAGNNSRISLKINEDDNSNFFVYGNDSVAIGNRKFTVQAYFNDNTIPTFGMVKYYIPKISSQIETLVVEEDEYGMGVYSYNNIDWIVDNSDNNYQQVYCGYSFVNQPTEEQWLQVSQLQFSYKNQNYYSSNNTIKCEIVNQRISHYTTRTLTFGNQNTAGTGYKLNVVCLNEVVAIKPAGTKAERTLTYQILLEDNNGNSLNNYLINNYKDKIEINFVGATPLKYTGFEINDPYTKDNKVLFDLVFGYNNISLDENGNPVYTFIDTDDAITKYKDKNVDTTINYDSVMIYNFSIFEVVVSKTALIGVNKPVNLRTKFPVAFRQDSVGDTWYAEQTALDGPTRVIYDNSYNNPTYDKKAIYQIHFKKIHTDGREENGIWGPRDYWRLFFIDNKGTVKNLDGGLSLTTLSEEEQELIGDGAVSEYWENNELKGGVVGDCRLSASDSLTSNFAYVNIGMSSENAWGNFKWSQPIIIETERYFTELIDSWDGSSILINNDQGTILSQMVGAGYKNSDNTFSGVFMGQIGKADGDYSSRLTGLYGYQQGQLRFKFDENGNAYIGNNNKGNYIDFTDGNLDIKTNVFSLNAPYLNLQSYKGDGLSIFSDANNSKLRVKAGYIETSGVYGLDIYDGAFRMYGVPYNDELDETDASIYFDSDKMFINGVLTRRLEPVQYSYKLQTGAPRITIMKPKIELGDSFSLTNYHQEGIIRGLWCSNSFTVSREGEGSSEIESGLAIGHFFSEQQSGENYHDFSLSGPWVIRSTNSPEGLLIQDIAAKTNYGVVIQPSTSSVQMSAIWSAEYPTSYGRGMVDCYGDKTSGTVMLHGESGSNNGNTDAGIEIEAHNDTATINIYTDRGQTNNSTYIIIDTDQAIIASSEYFSLNTPLIKVEKESMVMDSSNNYLFVLNGNSELQINRWNPEKKLSDYGIRKTTAIYGAEDVRFRIKNSENAGGGYNTVMMLTKDSVYFQANITNTGEITAKATNVEDVFIKTADGGYISLVDALDSLGWERPPLATEK